MILGGFRVLEQTSDLVDRLTQIAYVGTTATFAGVMLVGIFFRYVLNDSLPWSDELAVTLFLWASFLSMATTYRHGQHVKVEFFVERLPILWKSRAAMLADGLTGGCVLCLLVSGLEGIETVGRGHSDALRLPVVWIYAGLPFATAIILLHWMRQLCSSAEATATRAVIAVVVAGTFFAFNYFPTEQVASVGGFQRALVLTAILLVPIAIGVPVAFALGLVAMMYLTLVGTVPFSSGALQMYFGLEHISLLSIPLLILAGGFMYQSGMSQHIIDFAQMLVGRVRGGLGASNVVASYIFGDISGSAVSDTAAIGSIMIPEMKRRGYRADFCAALQGAAGTLGMTAPLSITLILYAVVTNVSVSRLAAATIIPATIVATSFALFAVWHGFRHRYPKETVNRSEIFAIIVRATPGLFALALIVGGILSGVFTPAEIGSVLLLYIVLLTVFLYRRARPRELYDTTLRTGHISGMTLLLISVSAFLGFMLGIDRVGYRIAEFVSTLTTNPLVVIALASLVFVILGMFLEAAPIVFSFMPSMLPLFASVGVDLVHWGVLFVINMGLGMLVPPIALNLFVSTSIAGVRYEQAVRAAIPFMIIMVIDIALVALFPRLALFMPALLYG